MTPPGGARALTAGERRMIAGLFGAALDAEPVRLHRARWWPFQPRRVVMAPDGHVWFHPQSIDWREDFAVASLGLRGVLMHELTHVWQHQRGVNLVLRRRPFARYRYLPLVEGKPFDAYGIEQQAEIVRHAYLLAEGAFVPGAPPLRVYRELLPFGPDDRPTV